MKKHSTRSSVFSAFVLFIVFGTVSADEPQTPPAKVTALEWLKKAREAAEKIDEAPDDGTVFGGRAGKLQEIAGVYLDLGEVDEAKAMAATLPESRKKSLLSYVPISLAHAGRFDEAIREAEAVNDPSALRVVCAIMARKDFTRALAMEDKLPVKGRDWTWETMTQDQVLAGNLKNAETVAVKVADAKEKERALNWLAAGRIAQRAKIDAGTDTAKIESELAAIAEARCQADDIEKAKQIVAVLKDADCRCRVHIAMAELQLRHDRKPEFRELLASAIKEAAANDDSIMGPLQRAARFLKIAELQVRGGDFDEATNTIGLADKAGNEEATMWDDMGIKSGGVFKNLGGQKALIALLILAGKIDEAAKVATREDGTMAPEAVAMLAEAYSSSGRKKDFNALMKKAGSPEVECTMYIAAAIGAAKKLKEEGAK